MKTFYPPRIKWPLWLGCGVWLGLELALFAGITRHAVRAARVGAALPGGWSWVSIAGWHLFIAAVGAALLWEPFVQLRTRFDDEGVRRPRFFKSPIFIRWSEVETLLSFPVRHRPYVLRIDTPGRSIEINTLFYEQPDRVVSFIEERVKSCVPVSCHRSPL